jgi:hypothetical protein
MRKAASLVILLAACMGLSACESTVPVPVPTRAQVIGTWRHGTATLELDKDGDFVVSGIPTGVVKQAIVQDGAKIKGPNITVQGTWKIGSGGNDAGGAPAVQLHFLKPTMVATFSGLTMLVEGSTTSNRQLYVDLGDPDANVQFAFTKAAG